MAKCPVFADLDDQERAGLLPLFAEIQAKAGQFLYFEGSILNHFYIVAEGRVKILKHSLSGKVFILAFAGPGEILGNVAILSDWNHPNSAQAVTDTKVLAVRNETFLAFLSQHSQLGFKVLRKILVTVHIRLAMHAARFTGLAVETTGSRLAYILSSLYLEHGPELPFTHEEVAQMAGTTPETATRLLNRWKQMGVIRPLRRKIIVLNPPKLELLTGDTAANL